VAGDDPWAGAPIAWLETADGEPVLRPNGEAIHSDSYLFWVELSVEPGWEDDESLSTPRRYAWSFSMPVAHHYPMADMMLSGDYRLRAELPRADGTVDEVVSGTFSVE
jgi:hypothetical protein